MLLWFLLASILMPETSGCRLYTDKVYGGIFADCSRRNLSSIPTDLPRITTSLNLSKNNITMLFLSQNTTFKELKYLDVSHNHLTKLENGTFHKFENLQELYLNNNNLTLDRTSFPDDVFQPLQNLRKLHLHNNDQRDEGSYPEDAFVKLTELEELKIDTFIKTRFGFGYSQLYNLHRLILGFEGCRLHQIRNETFENFRNISLQTLDLDNCLIMQLQIGSFVPLRNLQHLYMSNIFRVEPTTALLAMYGFRGRNISSIEMNNIFTVITFRDEKLNERVLSSDVLEYVKDVCVERFSMINSEVLWISNDVLVDSTFVKCIKYLDFSMNDLYGDVKYFFDISMLSSLAYLNLSSHGQKSGSRVKPSQFEVFGDLQLIKHGVTIPKTLEVLDMSGLLLAYRIFLWQPFHVYDANSLRSLSFASNGLIHMESKITGLEHLKHFDISDNNCSELNPAFYDDFPNLESLIMTDAKFGTTYLLNYGKRLLHPLKKLKTLSLHNNNLRLLDRNMLSTSQVEVVILSRNRFEIIPFDLLTTPHLHYLDLSFNSLAVLTHTEMKFLDDFASRNNMTLNIEGNVLSCGCQNLNFILWLYTTRVQVLPGSTYLCQMSDGAIANTSYINDHYEEIWKSCNGIRILSVTTVLFVTFCLIILVMYYIIRRKTLLVNIFLRLFGYGSLAPTMGRSEFWNDVYIGYSDADYKYICHTVRMHLENKHGLKLFIRDRDTIPGGQIADDIISGIDCSWKTLLILTEAYLNDEWCHFTLNRVVYSSGRRPYGSVILLLSGDVRRGDIDPALLNVVEERNIFYVEGYRGDEDRLWRDVCLGLKDDHIT